MRMPFLLIGLLVLALAGAYIVNPGGMFRSAGTPSASSSSSTPSTAPSPSATIIPNPAATPAPAPAPVAMASPPQECTIPNDAATVPALIPGIASGVIRAPGALVVPAGMTLKITGDLTIIAKQGLTVNGTITYAVGANGPTNPDARIILASENASVDIGPNALVGRDPAALLPTQLPTTGRQATGQAGKTAGSIVVISQVQAITNDGVISGMYGQGGQAAHDTVPAGQAVDGTATGGLGGAGAYVYLCARELITNNNKVESGGGGDGGSTQAIGGDSAKGTAASGRGRSAGDVVLVGLAPNNRVLVINNGSITGNPGGSGGHAVSSGGLDGGSAVSQGGSGSTGGSVQFVNVELNPVGILQAATGGNGGDGNASGTRGPQGGNGGSADSRGGNGGNDGAMPPIPVPPGAGAGAWGPLIVGIPAPTGKGGDATARGGASGGGAGVAGTQTATGGTGKSGAAPGAPAPTPNGGIISTGSP